MVGATVIDGTGAPPQPNTTVVLREKRIEHVGPAASIKVPPEAVLIDGRGLFLLPGFIDVNIHLFLNDTEQDLPAQVAVVASRAQEALPYGVTTLRDTHGRLLPLQDPLVDARGAGWQQILRLAGRYASARRAILTSEQQAVFDRRAATWRKELAELGYRVEISGVTPAP
jgi:hypothetical protein